MGFSSHVRKEKRIHGNDVYEKLRVKRVLDEHFTRFFRTCIKCNRCFPFTLKDQMCSKCMFYTNWGEFIKAVRLG